VAQVKEVVGNLRPATSVVVLVGKVLLVDRTGEEASGPPVFGARKAAVLPPGVVGPPVAAVVVGGDVGDQEIVNNKG